jgi:chromosomal replication initiation ATPase DnaA
MTLSAQNCEIAKRITSRNASDGDRHHIALLHKIEKTVAVTFHIAESELRAPTRRKATTAFARQVAMYIAHVGCGMNYSQIGRLFGRDRTTAAHACRLIEDRRDDPDFDLSLDYLERAVQLWAKRGAVMDGH